MARPPPGAVRGHEGPGGDAGREGTARQRHRRRSNGFAPQAPADAEAQAEADRGRTRGVSDGWGGANHPVAHAPGSPGPTHPEFAPRETKPPAASVMTTTGGDTVGGVRMDWKNDEVLKTLIEKAKQTGSLTYDEVNAALPPDVGAGPAHGDHGVSPRPARHQPDRRGDDDDEAPVAVAEAVIADAEAPSYEDSDGDGRRIDDPVRMYLTQMGEIPLLDPRAGNRAGQEDRSHPQALPPQGARVRLRPAAASSRSSSRSTPATCRSTAPSRCR